MALVLVAFAVQNAEIIPVQLLFWEFEISTALLMLLCFALGSVFMLMYTIPIVARMRKKSDSGTSVKQSTQA